MSGRVSLRPGHGSLSVLVFIHSRGSARVQLELMEGAEEEQDPGMMLMG